MSSLGATFNVTTNLDSGTGSFRQALLNANANVGADTITFNIGGPRTITLLTALPSVTETLTIDGSTQPGFVSAPIIELNGNRISIATRLSLEATNCIVRSLILNNFGSVSAGNAVMISGPGGCLIAGCYFGIGTNGTTLIRNRGNGIFITNSPNNIIGGTTAADRNIISGSTNTAY